MSVISDQWPVVSEKQPLRSYRELKVWQNSVELVTVIYQITASFPKEEMYGLTAQIRRSAISIPSNIAEGAARNSTKEFIRFVDIALGSLAELETQFIIANNLGFVSENSKNESMDSLQDVGKMLNGLKRRLNEKLH